MVVDFVPNSSRKKLFMEFTTPVLTSWEVITKRKELFE
jgi:hypothetical protein